MGRHACCELKRGADFHESFSDSFEEATLKNRIRMIKETDKMVYLYVVPPRKSEDAQQMESNHGESLSIQKDDLSFCRVAK